MHAVPIQARRENRLPEAGVRDLLYHVGAENKAQILCWLQVMVGMKTVPCGLTNLNICSPGSGAAWGVKS